MENARSVEERRIQIGCAYTFEYVSIIELLSILIQKYANYPGLMFTGL